MSTETKPAYSPGLAGVIAGETEICWVDPNAGLMYRGYDIHEMAEKANFEEVAYLLLNGELPTIEQLEEFPQRDRRGAAAARSRCWKCCGCCRRTRIRWICCAPASRCSRPSIPS